MSTLRRALAAATAAGLLFAGSAHAAAPAASLSLRNAAPATARAAAPAGASKIGAQTSTATYISVGLLVAFTAIVLIATKGNGNDSPASR